MIDRIGEITAYKCTDDTLFMNKPDAVLHQAVLDITARLDADHVRHSAVIAENVVKYSSFVKKIIDSLEKEGLLDEPQGEGE